MTLRECYDRMGADFDRVVRQLGKEERVRRYLVRVPEEPCFARLEEAFAGEDPEEAFNAAHTLKGISMNFCLTRLLESVSAMTDELRDGRMTERSRELLLQVRRDYEETVRCIGELDRE